jgi:lipoprotein-anchoring transpeptidase ErfK/SrfK
MWGPTDGCIGMTNEDVEVVYDAVRVGTRVVILP